MTCPNHGCTAQFTSPHSLEQHRAECSHEKVTCMYAGCGAQMLRSEVAAHEQQELALHLALERKARLSESQTLRAELEALRALLGQSGGPGSQAPRALYVPSQYGTIQAAIGAARSGDKIIAAEGLYEERVIIEKAVELVGVEGGGVVIEWQGGESVVEFRGTQGPQNGQMSMKDVALRHKGTDDGFITKGRDAGWGAVMVCAGASAQLERCELTSAAGAGIYAQGEGSRLELHGCVISDCSRSGLHVSQAAEATVDRSQSRFTF